MIIYGKSYEGTAPWQILPHDYQNISDARTNINHLRRYVENGGRVMIEITKGARKGTIGELVLDLPEKVEDLYKPIKTGLRDVARCQRKEWLLRFDDRDNVVKIPLERWEYKWNGVLRFGRTETVWAYETKARPKVEAVTLYDHFGVKLEVGQVVLFMHGKANNYHNRFGKISRISDKGTIWVEMFRTREGHEEGEVSHGVASQDIFVLDGDMREKAMLARLTVG